MNKRTNKIYNVQVAVYSWMAVEADSPNEAMELAKRYKDEYITEEDFEDSEVEISGCETYSSTIDDFDEDENIFCEDGVIEAQDYYTALKGQED